MLLGPSGCGKSTLLNCIAGLLDVSDGQIFIKGKNVTWEEPKDRGIGMVFQSYALYPQMTVEGNLSFGLKNAGVPKDEIERRIARAAEILQIEPLLDAQAVAAFRRPAPARRHRPRAGARCRRVPVRRAAVQPRRQAALGTARRDQAAAPEARQHHDLRHPRPDRGDDAGRPHRRHEGRPDPAARRAAGDLQAAGQPLRRRLHRLAGHELPRRRCRSRRTARRVSSPRASTSPLANYRFDRPAPAGPAVFGIRPEHIAINSGEDWPFSATAVGRDRRADGLRHAGLDKARRPEPDDPRLLRARATHRRQRSPSVSTP